MSFHQAVLICPSFTAYWVVRIQTVINGTNLSKWRLTTSRLSVITDIIYLAGDSIKEAIEREVMRERGVFSGILEVITEELACLQKLYCYNDSLTDSFMSDTFWICAHQIWCFKTLLHQVCWLLLTVILMYCNYCLFGSPVFFWVYLAKPKLPRMQDQTCNTWYWETP